MVVVGIALESLFWGAVWLCEERSRVWSHSVVEHLLCEVVCLGVRDGAAETLLTGVKVVPETMYLGKSSIGGDIAHIGDYLCLFVFIILYVSSAFLPPLLGDLILGFIDGLLLGSKKGYRISTRSGGFARSRAIILLLSVQ